MGEGWHPTGRGLYIFLWTGEWGTSVRDRFSYIRESYQWFGEWSLLVIRCRI
jgi:hypothetical protein